MNHRPGRREGLEDGGMERHGNTRGVEGWRGRRTEEPREGRVERQGGGG